MPDKKISELNPATTLTGVEVLAVVQDGETKKATGAIIATDPSLVAKSDIGTAPNEVPLNQYLGDLAYQNEDQFVIRPQTSAHPLGIGEMTFQLTNNTTLVVKVKGTDGTVRSTTLTLA
jgi:hypothetical protein